eukprot:jgi/Bigna1/60529/fgenesh1_kg.12_\
MTTKLPPRLRLIFRTMTMPDPEIGCVLRHGCLHQSLWMHLAEIRRVLCASHTRTPKVIPALKQDR